MGGGSSVQKVCTSIEEEEGGLLGVCSFLLDIYFFSYKNEKQEENFVISFSRKIQKMANRT